jgi:ferredoxin
LRVWIETQACTGSGLCAAIEPRVFAIGDDGLALVLQPNGDVPAEYADRVWEASDCCPGDCIRIHDATDAR